MLNNREELRERRDVYGHALDAERRKVLVCAGTGCVSGGSLDIFARLKEMMEQRGIPCSVELREEPHDEVGIKKSGCHGFCEMGPLLRIEPEGWLYTKVKLSDCEEIVDRTILRGEH
ncbi:MAG: (2Fe-2S) ferredoxin domain-containing protein, partial [Clostridiaceae bacterium]|nr:(2Fe-2S) ferredoxin domain-containing protein [Clostridiaceae bacterium]